MLKSLCWHEQRKFTASLSNLILQTFEKEGEARLLIIDLEDKGAHRKRSPTLVLTALLLAVFSRDSVLTFEEPHR